MKQGLSLRVSQHLALTPQLQQSIRLLQLSTLELSQEVEQMLDDNPFLEREDDSAEREAFGLDRADVPISRSDQEAEWVQASGAETTASAETFDDSASLSEAPNWDGDGNLPVSSDDSEWGVEAPARPNNLASDEERDAADWMRQQSSLQDHLHAQALGLRLSDVDRAALYALIESLNDDGYLEDGLADLAQALAGTQDPEVCEAVQHHLNVALGLLQHMEPTGVGARDLSECLRLQLQAMTDEVEETTRVLAVRLCLRHMDLLGRRDVKRLCADSGASELQVRAAMALIARLEPKPGRRFVDVSRHAVVPDVLVSRVSKGGLEQFQVQLNPDVMPRLRVHDVYAGALKGQRGGDASGLQQRLQEARWFIKNVQQRFDTILRVSTAIVQRQRNFFVHGELAMRPLVLREVADELGLHESTISRVTTAKYMATPFGTFELKYFFGSGLGTESGGQASSTAVRALIKQFVTAENPNKPLSDNQLADMLKEQGIACARRTVAKYREALRIAPANLRKQL